MLIIAATREAATTEKGLPITRAVINKLKDQKLLAPAPAQLIRLAMAAGRLPVAFLIGNSSGSETFIH